MVLDCCFIANTLLYIYIHPPNFAIVTAACSTGTVAAVFVLMSLLIWPTIADAARFDTSRFACLAFRSTWLDVQAHSSLLNFMSNVVRNRAPG
jgi:hypothetical protein